jgi:hypothetical protein
MILTSPVLHSAPNCMAANGSLLWLEYENTLHRSGIKSWDSRHLSAVHQIHIPSILARYPRKGTNLCQSDSAQATSHITADVYHHWKSESRHFLIETNPHEMESSFSRNLLHKTEISPRPSPPTLRMCAHNNPLETPYCWPSIT